MDRLLLVRTVLVGIGLVVWGYGYAADDANVRLAGIVVLAISLALRFLKRRKPRDTDAA